MAQQRRRESHRRNRDAAGYNSRRAEPPPKLVFRANQKLIAGYPSDSPVSTTDEEWEAEDLSNLKGHTKLASYEPSSPEEVIRAGLAQQQALLTGGAGVRGSKRRCWAPGEGVIDQHLFLLDDRPWQEFYTLFFSPVYLIAVICMLTLLLLLLLDGTLLFDRPLVFLAPSVLLVVGVLLNLLFVCLFPVPNGSSAPAYDNWTDPFNQQ